jgi:hypothetical protein
MYCSRKCQGSLKQTDSIRYKKIGQATSPPVPKPEIYEAIFALNRDLELVIAGFRRLWKLRFRANLWMPSQ